MSQNNIFLGDKMYSQTVLDLILNPQNVGLISDHDGIGKAGDEKCGDYLEISIKVKNAIITDIKFMVQGCVGAIASSSMTTIIAKNKPVMEAYLISDEDIIKALGGLPEAKKHCSVLGAVALKRAIIDYSKKMKNTSV